MFSRESTLELGIIIYTAQYPEALTDYNRAIVISPYYSDALEARSSVKEILDSAKK
jgi:hypothetical protein